MSTHDGCVVKEVFNHPSGRGVVALRAVWSGGYWSPNINLLVRQQRDGKIVGSWDVVGAERVAGDANPLLLLRPKQKDTAIDVADIMLLGEETVSTVIPLMSATLPESMDCAVQFGVARFHGVARFADGRPDSIVIFHRPDATLYSFEDQPIYWRGEQYQCSISLDRDEVFLDFSLSHHDVKVKWLLDALSALRHFTIDAGQQLLYQQRAIRKRKLVYDFFEPSLVVNSGSVLVRMLPGKPRQRPLVVRVSDPMRLLIDSLAEALNGSVQGLILTLSSRVSSVDILLNHLRSFARAAVQSGGLDVTLAANGEKVRVDNRFVATVEDALMSMQWREVECRGVMYGVETEQLWCRIAVNESNRSENWTIHFGKEWLGKISGGVIPRNVVVRFETVAPEITSGGRGELLYIDDIE